MTATLWSLIKEKDKKKPCLLRSFPPFGQSYNDAFAAKWKEMLY